MLSLIIPSFIAGVLTFLAPCTLPLVPAYLGFISGTSAKDWNHPLHASKIRKRAFANGLLYTFGFSLVFIFLGVIFGAGGAFLVEFKEVLTKVGGVFIFFFGLYLVGLLERIPFLQSLLSLERRLPLPKAIKSGTGVGAFLLGATFALGWTPCVGPILASVLLLASTTATIWQGAVLLMVFSAGLALPFLLLALWIGHATQTIRRLSRILPFVSFVGGVLLLLLGILLMTDQLGIWLSWAYRLFSFLRYEGLLEYL